MTTSAATINEGADGRHPPRKDELVPVYATEAMARDVLDTSSHLRDWNYRGTRCDRCGTPNSAVAGLLLQCGKCKSAYYCTSACFNADLQRHTEFCRTARLDRQPKSGPDLYRERRSGTGTDGSGEWGGPRNAPRTQLSLPDAMAAPRNLAPGALYRRPTRSVGYSSDDSDDSSSSSSSSSSEGSVTINTTDLRRSTSEGAQKEEEEENVDEEEEEEVVVLYEEGKVEEDEENCRRDAISTAGKLEGDSTTVATPSLAVTAESAVKEELEDPRCVGISIAVELEGGPIAVAPPSLTVAAENAVKEELGGPGRYGISTVDELERNPTMVAPPSPAGAAAAAEATVKEDAECQYRNGIPSIVKLEDDPTPCTPPSPTLAAEVVAVPESEPTTGPKPEATQDSRVPTTNTCYADADADEDADYNAGQDAEGDEEEDEYRRRGRIPVKEETEQHRRRLRVGDGIIPEYHWDPETVTLEEAETIRRQYGWDVPDWVLRSPLRRSKLGGRLAQDGANLSREKGDSRAQQPEWAVRSPLRRRSQQPGTVSPTQVVGSNEPQHGTPKKRVDDQNLANRRLDPNLASDDHPSTPTAATAGRATLPKNRAPRLPEWALNSPPKISPTKVRGTTTSDAARSPARYSSPSTTFPFPNTKAPSQPASSSPSQTRETMMSPCRPKDAEVGSSGSGPAPSVEPKLSTASTTPAGLSSKKSFPIYPRSPVRANLRNAPLPATSQLPVWVIKSPLRRRTAPPAPAPTLERGQPTSECSVAHTQLRSTAKKRLEGAPRSQDPLTNPAADPATNSP